MPRPSQTFIALLLAVAAHSVLAQDASSHAVPQPRSEIAASFDYMHSNAPVGGCGCFGLYGGQLTLAVPLGNKPVSFVADFSSGHNSSIGALDHSLTLLTWTAGARYTPPLNAGKLHPFAQGTVGLGYATGALASNGGAGFAMQLGGGADLDLSRRFRWRVAQASYLLTTFNNGSNNHQNNVQLDTGLVWKF